MRFLLFWTRCGVDHEVRNCGKLTEEAFCGFRLHLASTAMNTAHLARHIFVLQIAWGNSEKNFHIF